MVAKTTDNKDKSNAVDSSSEKSRQTENNAVNESEMDNSSLHRFFISAIKDIYFAENALMDASDQMKKEELKETSKDTHKPS
ncbi:MULTISPECIES: hypothetical protein [unclassified Chryseobacterium]|uniref:hypothetical protein n=1 Tax=unclassified Chryseobacterium TaxID=2593645 RepID=UPI000D3C0F94|nr:MULTISPECIES: hypothetical protein [unclassified Chryseobacterium]PTT71839.1 hypothetical protein DBR25_15940 [Chryseobacterium sp. HMWF001]PVV55054.1 hypothetical protein DD829_16075 [Chryseobacterium sp. HMWF035]